MTQKEYKEKVRDKADELIDKFSVFANGEIESEVERHNSIQCAKILAQQIIRVEMTREFWEEVMNELNK